MESEITAGAERDAKGTFPGVGSARLPPASVLLGETVGGYVLERVLGEGTSSVVYLGRHARLGTSAAVKIANVGVGEQSGVPALARLEAEARATLAIDSPHVVRVLDVGELPGPEPRRAYAVMAQPEGRTLDVVIAHEAPLPVGETRALLRQLATGMAAAHRAGIVHCDLKPSNVLLHNRTRPRAGDHDEPRIGEARILDFGSAKSAATCLEMELGLEDEKSQLVGTPAYCAPEQIRGRHVGPAADIYALGAIAHELLTGQPLWKGSADRVLAEKMFRPADPIGRSDVPPDFDALIMSMLAREPHERPASMEDVIVALDTIGSSSSEETAAAVTPARRRRLGSIVLALAVGAVTIGGIAAAIKPTSTRALETSTTRASSATVASAATSSSFTKPLPDEIPPPPAASETSVALAPASAPALAPRESPSTPPMAGSSAGAAPKTNTPKSAASSSKTPSAASKSTLVDPFSTR